MTLTTERQQFEKWWETAMHNGYPPRFGWEHWRDGDGYRDDDGEFQGLWQAWQASRGFLANRETQPVAWHFPGSETESAQLGYDHELDDEQKQNCIALYTAPPAPAVPDGYCVMPLTLTAENGAKCALAGEFKVSRTVRCHECGGEGCDDCADAGEFEEEITVPWDTIKDIYRAAVDACRSAILAQPVSQRYKLVPVEPTAEMIQSGVAAHYERQRLQIHDRPAPGPIECAYIAMLAAAPEGGK